MRTKKTGRPRLYRNAMQMQEKIDEYFLHCEQYCKPLSVSALANHLGFASTQCLRRYMTTCKARSHFSTTIKRALLRIEVDKSERLVACRDASRAKGLIFDLKVNHGWREPARRVEVGRKSEEKAATVLEIGWSEWMERFGQREQGAAG